MLKEYQIGDSAYLKRPERGYRYVEIIGFSDERLDVRTVSGMELSVFADELEDE